MAGSPIFHLIMLLLTYPINSVQAGFEWGAGCEGGSGEFTTALLEGETLVVGDVPSGLWNVQVLLTATSDVDVQVL